MQIKPLIYSKSLNWRWEKCNIHAITGSKGYWGNCGKGSEDTSRIMSAKVKPGGCHGLTPLARPNWWKLLITSRPACEVMFPGDGGSRPSRDRAQRLQRGTKSENQYRPLKCRLATTAARVSCLSSQRRKRTLDRDIPCSPMNLLTTMQEKITMIFHINQSSCTFYGLAWNIYLILTKLPHQFNVYRV